MGRPRLHPIPKATTTVLLDKDRSYGTIFGDSIAVYEQDGLLFDAHGVLIDESERDSDSGEAET